MNKNYLLHGQMVKVRDLGNDDIGRMIELFKIYFANIKDEKFLKDLYTKDCVLLLKDAHETIQGFTTIKFLKVNIESKSIRAIFSGNTIIAKDFWGKSDMPRVWMQCMLAEKGKNLDQPLYWFLICSGYKTYKMLPNYFREFWPRYDRPMPPEIKKTIDFLAASMFGSDYDRKTGIIRFSDTQERLRGEYSKISEALLTDPHINFFAQANPGHHLGHELACLADFCDENLNDYAHQTLH